MHQRSTPTIFISDTNRHKDFYGGFQMSRRPQGKYFFMVVLGMAMMLLNGCASTSPQQPMDVPPMANSIASHDDIVLPADLEWDSSKSIAIKTESFSGGIYHYSGRVELNSLKEFIKTSMTNNKWKLVGEAAYETTMLAFIKPNKTCMVTLSESIGGVLGKSNVKLYVTVDLAAAKGLNPFGEPVN